MKIEKKPVLGMINVATISRNPRYQEHFEFGYISTPTVDEDGYCWTFYLKVKAGSQVFDCGPCYLSVQYFTAQPDFILVDASLLAVLESGDWSQFFYQTKCVSECIMRFDGKSHLREFGRALLPPLMEAIRARSKLANEVQAVSALFDTVSRLEQHVSYHDFEVGASLPLDLKESFPESAS